jgi:hypothetical protein
VTGAGNTNGLVLNQIVVSAPFIVNPPQLTGGTTPTQLTVCINPADASVQNVGTYNGTVTVNSPNAIPAVVNVQFVVNAQPVLSTSTIAYSYVWGATSLPAAQTISVTSTPTGASNLSLATSGDCTWLNAALNATTAPTVINTSLKPASKVPGTYSCTLTVSGQGGNPIAPAINSSTVVTLTVSQQPFFNGNVDLGGGIKYLQFSNGRLFGYYVYMSQNILYHFDAGYLSVIPANDANSGLYMYDFKSGHWWYTSSSSFPFVYDFTINAWLYYFPQQPSNGHYTTSPRYFVNMNTNVIFTM